MDYKEIYVNYVEYQKLSKRAKELFDLLFKPLLLDGSKNYTNKYLAEQTGESVSSVEKHFKEFRDNKLLLCKITSYKQFGAWQTTRTIELDPIFLARLKYDKIVIIGANQTNSKKREEEECLF